MTKNARSKSIRISNLLIFLALITQHAIALDVMITPEIGEFTVQHGSHQVLIKREQDTGAMLEFNFARIARPCPPFCAQPMQAASGVETIAEVELIAFMQQALRDGTGLMIDARTSDWHGRGTIPGSINIPYTHLNTLQGANEITLEEPLTLFGAVMKNDNWDFSDAKTLVLWCNGPWCGQSPAAIRGLISIGYPAEKLLYYRGGMQLWQIFGLPVVSPEGILLDE